MAKDVSTWRELILTEMEKNGEVWDDVQKIVFFVYPTESYFLDDSFSPLITPMTLEELDKLTDNQKLDLQFSRSYGTDICPIRFTLWATKFIYFSYDYDGRDYVMSVLRNPPRG